MAILKEYRCQAHGPFEAFADDEVPECPNGCSARWVKREIRTAPAAGNVRTGKMDALQRDLAHNFGLSDLKTDKENGKSVIENLRGMPDFSPKWVDVPGKQAAGWSQRGEKPAAVDVASTFGMQAGNALADSKPSKSIPTQLMGKWDGKST
jgi:hypothetical protein